MERALNEQSGFLGVSGVSPDLREVLVAADAGNRRAQLARDIFIHRLVSGIGGMVATLRGLDALVFTGGIGEHSAPIRAAVCEAFRYLAMHLDLAINDASPVDRDLASAESGIRVLVVTAREDLSVLRQVKRVLNWPV
jgi:acetate kinase